MFVLYMLKLTALSMPLMTDLGEEKNELTLQIVTVATDETDGYARFMQSAKDFGLQVEVSFLLVLYYTHVYVYY